MQSKSSRLWCGMLCCHDLTFSIYLCKKKIIYVLVDLCLFLISVYFYIIRFFPEEQFIYASSSEALPLQFPFLLPQKLYGCRMNTERIKSPTQIIFRFTSFQQAHNTRSAHIFNSELTFTPPNCSHIHHRNRYFINCRCDNDVPWGNHNKPFRNNAHGTFIHIIIRRLKEDFSVAASVAGDEQERAFAGPTYS